MGMSIVEHMIEGRVESRAAGRQRIPEELAEMPPGPRLATLLAGLDRSRLNGHDLVILAMARARQVAHDQAQLLSDIAEVAHCPPGDADSPVARVTEVDEFAADEIRMALTLTRRAAEAMLALALDLTRRLPRVHAALLAGQIDLARARVFSQETSALSESAARQVVDQVIDAAEGLTTGQLAARIRRLVITTDPEAAHRRQERSVTRRRVESGLDPHGTATLAGHHLPPDRSAAAVARIDELARARKQAGDPRTMDQLRADTFLDLLDGTAGSVVGQPAAADGANASGQDRRPAPRGGVELRVPLTTLMGLSEQPGELAGWGPVIAEIARQVAQRQQRSPWRVSVYDKGRIIHHGPLRRRPTIAQAKLIKARDNTCRAPGCRVPAHRADVDHTRPYAQGGATKPDNLGVLCRHDHRLKDEGGWKVRQISEGVFIWYSRLGHQYTVTPDPPLPP